MTLTLERMGEWTEEQGKVIPPNYFWVGSRKTKEEKKKVFIIMCYGGGWDELGDWD